MPPACRQTGTRNSNLHSTQIVFLINRIPPLGSDKWKAPGLPDIQDILSSQARLNI